MVPRRPDATWFVDSRARCGADPVRSGWLLDPAAWRRAALVRRTGTAAQFSGLAALSRVLGTSTASARRVESTAQWFELSAGLRQLAAAAARINRCDPARFVAAAGFVRSVRLLVAAGLDRSVRLLAATTARLARRAPTSRLARRAPTGVTCVAPTPRRFPAAVAQLGRRG